MSAHTTRKEKTREHFVSVFRKRLALRVVQTWQATACKCASARACLRRRLRRAAPFLFRMPPVIPIPNWENFQARYFCPSLSLFFSYYFTYTHSGMFVHDQRLSAGSDIGTHTQKNVAGISIAELPEIILTPRKRRSRVSPMNKLSVVRAHRCVGACLRSMLLCFFVTFGCGGGVD